MSQAPKCRMVKGNKYKWSVNTENISNSSMPDQHSLPLGCNDDLLNQLWRLNYNDTQIAKRQTNQRWNRRQKWVIIRDENDLPDQPQGEQWRH